MENQRGLNYMTGQMGVGESRGRNSRLWA